MLCCSFFLLRFFSVSLVMCCCFPLFHFLLFSRFDLRLFSRRLVFPVDDHLSDQDARETLADARREKEDLLGNDLLFSRVS